VAISLPFQSTRPKLSERGAEGAEPCVFFFTSYQKGTITSNNEDNKYMNTSSREALKRFLSF
jgi:hypothetical protein